MLGLLFIVALFIWFLYNALGGKAFLTGLFGFITGSVSIYFFLSAYTDRLNNRGEERARIAEHKVSQMEKNVVNTQEQYDKYREELEQDIKRQKEELKQQKLSLDIAEKEVFNKRQELQEFENKTIKRRGDLEKAQEQKRRDQEQRMKQLQKGLDEFI